MNGWKLLVGIAGFLVVSHAAEPIILPNPLFAGAQQYEDATITHQDAVYLTISHRSGIGRIPIASLSPPLRQQLGYDEQASARVLERERQRQIAASVRPADSTIPIHGILLANTERGLVVSTCAKTGEKRQVSQWFEGAARWETAEEDIYKEAWFLIRKNPNAVYLKPGSPIDELVTPIGPDFFKAHEVTAADFVRAMD